ncbi:hypothetical protein BD777DRAFT_128236, partial [Yarrowia lipolytica]
MSPPPAVDLVSAHQESQLREQLTHDPNLIQLAPPEHKRLRRPLLCKAFAPNQPNRQSRASPSRNEPELEQPTDKCRPPTSAAHRQMPPTDKCRQTTIRQR